MDENQCHSGILECYHGRGEIMEQIVNLPPTKTNPEIKIKEMELAVLARFLSSDRQKTQITSDERVLIGVLDGYSNNPYPISAMICQKLGIPYQQTDFTLDFMKEFLKCFIEYGIPVDRNGRTEEVKVISSYFAAQHEEKEQEKVSTKLMK
jgi:hypothetical protein